MKRLMKEDETKEVCNDRILSTTLGIKHRVIYNYRLLYNKWFFSDFIS